MPGRNKKKTTEISKLTNCPTAAELQSNIAEYTKTANLNNEVPETQNTRDKIIFRSIYEICDFNSGTLNLNINSLEKSKFSMLMPQLTGKFHIEEDGVLKNKDSLFDEICLSIFNKANKEAVDLLVMPEYSVSYDLIEYIFNENEFQPPNGTLWCLPMQAISSNVFKERIKQWNNQGFRVIFEEKYIDYQEYINVLIYAFLHDDVVEILLQCKTYHERDFNSLTNNDTMSSGNVIYIFGNRKEKKLLSLLCDDILNTKITAEAIIEIAGNNPIVINPQLNVIPKFDIFLERRNFLFFNKNIGSIFICQNWKKGTNICGKEINEQWSYISKKNPIKFEAWCEQIDVNALYSNYQKHFFCAYYDTKEVEIWFPYNLDFDSVHKVSINKSMVSTADLRVNALYKIDKEIFDNPITSPLAFLFKTLEKANEYKNMYLDDKSPYYIPSNLEKHQIDSFFNKITCSEELNHLKMSAGDNLDNMFIDMNKTIMSKIEKFIQLTELLKNGNLPEHYGKELVNNHKYKLVNKSYEIGNLTDYTNKEDIIVSITNDESKANKYLSYAQEKYSLSPEQLPTRVCIFLKLGDTPIIKPRFNTRRSDPNKTDDYGLRTEG